MQNLLLDVLNPMPQNTTQGANLSNLTSDMGTEGGEDSEFLSMLMDSIENNKNLSLNDVKAKQTTKTKNPLILQKEQPNLVKNTQFMQILKLLDELSGEIGDEKNANVLNLLFDEFDISKEEILQIKSLGELFDILKNKDIFKDTLANIQIFEPKLKDLKILKDKFANLEKIGFFETKISQSIFENRDFMQILNILENTTQSGQKSEFKFPLMSNSLEKIFSEEKNIIEIKSAKNLNDLIKIANKLGLEPKIVQINTEEIEQLKNEFKNLDEFKFFDQNRQPKLPNLDLKTIKFDPQNQQIVVTPKTDSNLEKLLAKDFKEVSTKELVKEAATKEPVILDQTKPKPQEPIVITDPKPKPEPKNTKFDKPNLVNLSDKITPKDQGEIAQKNALNMGEFDDTIDQYLKNISKLAKQNATANLAQNTNLSQAAAQTTQSNLIYQNEMQSDFSDILKDDAIDHKITNNSVKESVANAKINLKNNLNLNQTMLDFAQNLQDKMSQYKPPMTRFAMTLNPAELGEVSVVMLSRANNLHINITSTNQTMQIFLQNQAEFRQNLINMGFTEVDMRFSSDSQGQGKNQQQNKNAKKAYEEQDLVLTENSRINLELIFPRYV